MSAVHKALVMTTLAKRICQQRDGAQTCLYERQHINPRDPICKLPQVVNSFIPQKPFKRKGVEIKSHVLRSRVSWHFWAWPLIIVSKLSGSLRRAPEVAVVEVRRGVLLPLTIKVPKEERCFADIRRVLQRRLLHTSFS